MQLLIGLLGGIAASSIFWVGAMRRAEQKPEGRTAKIVSLLSGKK